MDGYVKFMLLPVIMLLLMSCTGTGIMKDVPVKLVRPAKEMSLSPDTSFRHSFPEVLHCHALQIVSDSIMVMADQVSENNPYHFKAYSTNTFEYLGSFVRKGRGPGEMIYPSIALCNAEEPYLNLYDYTAAYMIDVEKTIDTRQTVAIYSTDLTSDVIDWLPLQDSIQFIYAEEGEELVFHVVEHDGAHCRSYHPYEDIDGKRCLTHLSSRFVSNGNTGGVAEVMISFPQINIIDTESGEMFSIAVDNSYRTWKRVLGKVMNLDMINCYYGASATSEYIIATYRNLPLREMRGTGHGTSVHIFDWTGDFLYDIKVSEDIGNITYDCIHKYLYCLDMDGGIIRYDLSAIL